MSRLLIALFLVLNAFATPTTGLAQVSERAYAPENIGQLSVSDQIRVIEKEYREQSGGRQIPDDQLDFYLDQIRFSNWTFSQIKSDIASSLRGNPHSWNPPSHGTWHPQNVICSSNDRRYNECRTAFRGPARLVENISTARCTEGQSWGSRQQLVWVNNGCRGRFADSFQYTPAKIRCESLNARRQECRKPYTGTVYMSRQLSSQICLEGKTWGQSTQAVWVNAGCRAEFSYRDHIGQQNPAAYSVTCSSLDGRLKTCAWDHRRGTPYLLERISGRCLERYDWSYDKKRGLWVTNYCSARFGAR